MTDLQPVLLKLGLTQYFDKLSAEGFETWETVLNITESDLDALGVKLGHRRLLQREIALTRGFSVDQQIVSSQSGASDQSRSADHNKTSGKGGANTGAKRKYRRHPKIDENAPEKPPSAYVIFSNRIREELKPQNLSFTAIAKKVGERWQNLPVEAKEPYEAEASLAKEKYHAEMAEYKTTKSYREYQQYLTDFKAKNSSHSEDKRPKLVQDESTTSSGSVTSHPTDAADAVSGSTDFRAQRLGSSSSSGPQSTPSGFSSPASVMSGTSALRTGFPLTRVPASVSPIIVSPTKPSSRKLPLGAPQQQAAPHSRQSKEAFSDKIPSESAIYISAEGHDRQQPLGAAPLSEAIDRKIWHTRPGSLEVLTKSGCSPPSFLHNTSDSSSKSSVASTQSAISTANSSILPPATLEEQKRTGLSLPSLPVVAGSSPGSSSAYTDAVVARQNIEPLPGRSVLSGKGQPSSQLSLASPSQGMKFESLQLPLPYNISFGQRPLPRPERDAKLANIFDMQDIPRERKSLKDLTLQHEHGSFSDAPTPQYPPAAQHLAHVPKLPSLHLQSGEEGQDGGLHPNADPLSVLAYAGRLVGRDGRPSP